MEGLKADMQFYFAPEDFSFIAKVKVITSRSKRVTITGSGTFPDDFDVFMCLRCNQCNGDKLSTIVLFPILSTPMQSIV